jgi:3-methylcrotonyl-CoA carboxylase alpha subunit
VHAWFLKRLVEHEAFAVGRVTTGFIGEHLDALTERPQPSAATLSHALDRLRADVPGPAAFRLNAAPRAQQALDVDGERVMFDYQAGAQAEDESFVIAWPRTHGVPGAAAADGAILAPMPGKVIAVDVKKGVKVTEGQRLVVLEAMKMEHALTAPFAGTVAELTVKQGDQVEVEALLAKVERAPET